MYIISDTNIWIDFVKIGRLGHPFLLDAVYCVSQATFDDEMRDPPTMREELVQYGLSLIATTDDDLFQAVALTKRYPQLSLYDALALLIAKGRSWILLTGDKPLRKAAEREGVTCHGVIWIYDQLYEQGKMTLSEFHDAISALILVMQSGKRRFPMNELQKRLK